MFALPASVRLVLAVELGRIRAVVQAAEDGRVPLARVEKEAQCVALDSTQLAMLLDGIDVA